MLLNLDRLEHRTAPTFSTAIGAYGTEANDAHLFAEDLCTLMATVTSGFASEPPFNVNGTRNLSYNDRLLDLEHYLETHFDYTDTRTERVASVQPSRVATCLASLSVQSTCLASLASIGVAGRVRI